MKVTTTTLPRRSARPTRAPSCIVRAKSGAGPIRERRASAFAGCAPACAPPLRSAAPTSAIRSRECPRRTSASQLFPDLAHGAPIGSPFDDLCPLCLQFLPQLVDEPPIGALGDDLLRRRPDHVGLA